MFLEEPEGQSFSDLNQYLAAACAMGTAISIELRGGKKLDVFLNYSQSGLPEFLEVFLETNKYTQRLKTTDIIWFKLKNHGKVETYIDENGVETSKPIIMIVSKEFSGNGQIINPGTTSIYGDKVNFTGKINSGEENND